MKQNANDNYLTEEGSNFIEDGDTGDKLLYMIDRKNNIVIRSMLEEDIKEVVAFSRLNSIKKKELKKDLKEKLQKKGSEMNYFIIEEIQPIDYNGDNFKSENWDWVYGYPKKKVGMAMKKIENVATKKQCTCIDGSIFYNCNDQKVPSIKKIMNKVYNEVFGIEGEVVALPMKK